MKYIEVIDTMGARYGDDTDEFIEKITKRLKLVTA